MMYSRREKIAHFDRLKGSDHAAEDVSLLLSKMPSHPRLSRFEQFPHRYAIDILYALLDVCTAEEIEENRKTAHGSSKASIPETSSEASCEQKEPAMTDGSSEASCEQKESTTADGSSKTLADEADKTDEENTSGVPDATDPPSAEEAKKK